MHIHSATQYASSIRSQEANDANTTTGRAIGTASPFPATAGGASTTSGAATGGTAASSPFASLSSNLQALLLGVGQNGQSAAGGQSAGAAGALQAYAQGSLFG